MSVFAYYNYQFTKIHPEPVQARLFEPAPELPDVEDNFVRRQEILSELLRADEDGTRPIEFTAEHRDKIHGHKWLVPYFDGLAVLRIQNPRIHIDETKDFREEQREDYPSCVAIIDNRTGIQRIVIEKRVKAFSDTNQVSRILEHTLRQLLRPYGLGISVDRLHTRDAFWRVALDQRTYPLGFKKIRIHLPPLNLERLKEAYLWSQNQARKMFGGTDLTQEQCAPEGGKLVFDENDPEQQELITVMTELVGGDGTIQLYPNGKKQNWVPIGRDNYRTAELPDRVMKHLESDDEDERRRAMDDIGRFTKKFIEL